MCLQAARRFGGAYTVEDSIVIDSMTLDDLDGVLAIERKSFPTPWSRFAFQTELTRNQYALYVVARLEGRIMAYAGTWVVLDEAHITNVAVDPDYRGRGYGRALLRALLSRARSKGATRATLEVRNGNKSAQQLYISEGFTFQGIRRGYYTDTNEDGLIMWKDDLSDIEPWAEPEKAR